MLRLPYFLMLFFFLSFNALSSEFLTVEEKQYLESQKTIKVGVLDGNWLPYWGDIESKKGINIEYAETMLNEFGVQAEYVPYKNLDALFSALEVGDIDLSVGFVATKNRAKRFLYSKPIFQTLRLFWLRDENLASKPLSDLKWVCVRNSSTCEQIESLGFKHIHTVNSTPMLAESLKSGATDAAIVGLSSINSYGFKTANGELNGKVLYDKNLKPGNVTIFTPKHAPELMNIINKYIEYSKVSKSSRENIEVNINVLHNELMIKLLEEHRGRKNIRYTISDNSYPMSYLDPQTGELKGYVHDLMKLLEQKSLLTFEYIDAQGKDVDVMLKEGFVDLLPARNIAATDHSHFRVSRPLSHLKFGYIESLNDNAKNRVAILDRSGNFYAHFLANENYSSAPVYREFDALMDAFKRGEISHAFVNEALIDNLFYQGQGSEFKPTSAPQDIDLRIPLGMEVRKDSDLLLKLINTVLSITTEAELEQLRAQHDKVNVQYGIEKGTVIIWALGGTCILLIALIIYILRTSHLTRTIRRKEYETQLRQKQNRWLTSVLNQIPNMILISDAENKQVLANKPFLNLLSRCNKDTSISKAERAHILSLIRNDKHSDVMETSSVCQLGEQHFQVRKQTLLNPIEGEQYNLTVFDDITEIKLKQLALNESNKKAIQAIEARNHFLAVVSHELRTPIAAILGLMELLEPELERDQNRELLRNAMLSAERLKLHVNDILDFSKIEANQIQLDIQSGNIYQELSPILRSFEKIAEQRGLQFIANWQPTPYAFVELDWLRINQVMNNLISNAVKFTENGQITVDIHVRQHELQLAVTDSGCGMTEQQLESLFLPFVQGDKSVSRRFGGTGLGMSIVKSLVEIMSGTIEVQSQLGKGSSVNVRIPLVSQLLDLTGLGPISTPDRQIQRWLNAWQVTADEYELKDHIIASELHYSNTYPDYIYQQLEMNATMHDLIEDNIELNKSSLVMVVDDDAINRLLFMRQFEKIGVRCTVFNSAQQAMNWLEQTYKSDQALPVSLIISDCHMPELSGYQFAQQLSKDTRFSTIPIVGCTAENSKNVIEKAKTSGMEQILFKPYTLEGLRELCEQYLSVELQAVSDEDWLSAYTDDEKREMAVVVCESLNADIALIESNEESLKSIAHRIKGSAAVLNLVSLKKKALQCEKLFGTPQEQQAKDALLIELRTIVANTAVWLQVSENG
ncbi:transporter substrate-binding domain-containing protein [Vibrio alfacsensis]|uniref:ATP-binding protein n=1 Tax=Vibrio alfacsensis TaxID=1074311 RepID=UPI002ADDB799|nr:transporter substrate-binding domain-containing protein [Vibrio alfacsensis]WQE78083.1 transporter substrate-binding domain-containing protein [Vibrio alfacsensis]